MVCARLLRSASFPWVAVNLFHLLFHALSYRPKWLKVENWLLIFVSVLLKIVTYLLYLVPVVLHEAVVAAQQYIEDVVDAVSDCDRLVDHAGQVQVLVLRYLAGASDEPAVFGYSRLRFYEWILEYVVQPFAFGEAPSALLANAIQLRAEMSVNESSEWRLV